MHYHWWQWRRRFRVNRYVKSHVPFSPWKERRGGAACVRACFRVCVSARVRSRVLSYSKPPFWKKNCWDTACADTNTLSSLNWIEVSKNQFRHTHKQICAVWMMQRHFCWLSQGLFYLNIWNCQHAGLSPVKWIFENCVKGSLSSRAAK